MAAKGSETSSQLPYSDVPEAVSFVERGGTLTKMGTSGKKYTRYFFVDIKMMAMCHTGLETCGNRPHDTMRIWVPVRSIEEVVRVEDGQSHSMFTIAVWKEKRKTLIAPSQEVRDCWVDGLRWLISARSVDDPVKQERTWLEERFVQADQNRDGLLDRDEVTRLLNALNVCPEESKVVKSRIQSEKLNFDQFVALYHDLSKRRELEDLFNRYANDHHYMTVDELAQFFRTEENEVIPRKALKDIILSSERCPALKDPRRLGFAGFCGMFTSARMNIKKPCCLSVYQDMTQPLSHYFISSSHNTYIDDYQIEGQSDAKEYGRVLLGGCRCVELDVWDGDDGEPVIFHGLKGVQMTSGIPFKDVLAVINDSAFVENDQLVILSIESHASEKQQVRMAELLRDTFRERLFREPLWQGDAVFPSPDQLRGRVIIQGRKPSGKSEDDDDSDDEVPAGEEVSEKAKQIRQKKKAKVEPMSGDLADCVSFYQAASFKNFDESSDKISFLNISESNVGRWNRESGGLPFVKFDVQKLSRVYPTWWRITSGNYNPVPHWMAGCQVGHPTLYSFQFICLFIYLIYFCLRNGYSTKDRKRLPLL